MTYTAVSKGAMGVIFLKIILDPKVLKKYSRNFFLVFIFNKSIHIACNGTVIVFRSQQIKHRAHDDVIKWKHFPRYWPFMRGIHRSPVNSPHKGQWRGALMFSLICAWINGWVNNREAGYLRRHGAHYNVIVVTETKVSMTFLYLFLSKGLIYCYSIHVPGWLQKLLNLITAHGSVSNEPGSVTWLATKYLKTVSWRNHTEKLTTLWPQNISFWPKINIPS